MSEFFRFRSVKSLLDEFHELEKQTIYFASPDELNDPMEGFRDLVWSGDKIVWTNFFRHYVYCLHRTFLMFRLIGNEKQLDADSIPIFGPWDEFVTSQDKDLFDDIWTRFLNVPKMQDIIEAIANTKRKVRYREMVYYLRVVHGVVLEEVLKSHIALGLISESKMPLLAEELDDSSMLEVLLYSIRDTQGVEDAELSDDELLPLEVIDNDESIFQQYNSRTISSGTLGKNDQFVRFDFPKAYLGQLEKLLWPKWYTACFMKSCHNSSVWGNYGDNHKGVCLIFEAEETSKSKNLELRQLTGKGVKTMPFHEVRYEDKAGEVDFFRSIGRLTLDALKKLWYTDLEGNISECASHIGPDGDEEAWQKSYWANFFRDITIKTKDWEYEQEYRLILEDGLSEFDDKKDRTLTYNFNSLKGIVFGLKTSDEDKRRIIGIVKEKCKKYNRSDFRLFQAYYSRANGDIRKYDVKLPFRTDLSSDTSEKALRAELAFQQGNSRMMLGQMDGVIEAYSRATEFNPNHAEAHLGRGVAYNVRGEFAFAIQDLTTAIDLKPKLVLAYYHRGHAYIHTNDYDLAVDDYTLATQLNPSFAEGYLSRAVVYTKKGKFDGAIEDYTKAIQMKLDFAEAYFGRGVVYDLRGEFSPAIEDFTHVIQLKPGFAEAYCSRGFAYGKNGDLDRAMEDFNTAMELNPDLARDYTNRLNAYNSKDHYDRAVRDYTKLIELNPDDANAHFNRGLVYVIKGEVDRAIKDCDVAIELEPEYAEAYFNRGLVYAIKSEIDCAIKDYNKAIELKPEYAEAYYNRGLVYAIRSEFDRAIRDYDKTIKLKPEYAEAYYNRGIAYYSKEAHCLAIEDFSKAIEFKPDNRDAYFHRAVVYAVQDDYNRAILDYTKAIELDPSYAIAYNNRGVAYSDKTDYDRAILDYTKAIELNPDYAEAYNNRGVAYAKQSEVNRSPRPNLAVVRAIKDYNAAIGLNPKLVPTYYNRGEAWLRLREWEKATSDLIVARDKGMDIITAFRNGYESVAEFERRNDVIVPEDIVIMVMSCHT